MRGDRRLTDDQWANVAVFAMFAAAVVYAFVVTSLTGGRTAGSQSWPVPGEPANLDGWRSTGDAETVSVDADGWLVAAPTGGRLQPVAGPVSATTGGVRVEATLEGSTDVPGHLPVIECFSGPGGGYEVSFGDGTVTVEGGSLSATEGFDGADGGSVEAVVTCDISEGRGVLTVAGTDTAVDMLEFTDFDPPPAGPVGVRLDAGTAVRFAALEVTTSRTP